MRFVAPEVLLETKMIDFRTLLMKKWSWRFILMRKR